MTGPAVVEAHGVTKRYGATVALREVGIAVLPGESHALVGRNGAGKSTLVNVLTGMERPDEGRVLFHGEPAPAPADREAWRRRVACVHQHSTVIGALSVAENLFLGRWPTVRGPVVGWRRMRREAGALLEEWGVPVDAAARADRLGVAEGKLVEIARALSLGARLVILDEPTAQLDRRAAGRLFAHMRRLKEAGVTFLYISHHLVELSEVCEVVTVLRDARRVLTAPLAGLPGPALLEAMTGEPARSRPEERPPRRPPPASAPVALRVERLSGPRVREVSLAVRAGEVVGLTGLAGSGAHQVGEVVAGLLRARGGRVEVMGRPLRTGSVTAALAAGVGCLPRDRAVQGILPGLSVAENITLPVSGSLGPFGLVRPRVRDVTARRAIAAHGIVTRGPRQPAGQLSGGNQQKVAMARALAADPRVLVLLDPTAGVDEASRRALLSVAERAGREGRAVLVVSDQLADLRVCDRVLVMTGGRVTAEYPAGWAGHELVAAIEGAAPAAEGGGGG
ncbi:sugar ABC transporter ATP-binding protein [Streptomyces capparidis]